MSELGNVMPLATADPAMDTALRIFRGAVAASASDVHLRAGQPPLVRIQGELCPLDHPALEPDTIESITRNFAGRAHVSSERVATAQVEFGVSVPDVGRFRVHAYRQQGTRAIVARHIPMPVPDFGALRLPPVIKPISAERRGLVLVTGATGNGKSTTIASMLEYMNKQSCRHIVTIENPIEFVFRGGESSFSQREIGTDIPSARDGLLGALREDPDVIFVGEIRTAEEFDVALNAAEAGHLVVSTLHSTDSMAAVQRMLGFYPPEMEAHIRSRLADAITAIVCQKLLPSRGGRDRVLVTEVMRRGPTIVDCIRDATRFRGLPAALDSAFHELGTHSFDSMLLRMARGGVIALDTARAAARSEKDLVRQLKLNR
ncbi:MAG: PilT/PilU family type 4a pilus ATPase [Myxococcota bacterium]